MSFEEKELSDFSGAPSELYRFAVGPDAYHFTSSDTEKLYLGDLYTPEPISRTEIDQSGEGEAGSIQITVPRTNPAAAYFIGYVPEPPMAVTLYRFHLGDVEVLPMFVGKVGACRFQGSEAVLTCYPISEALRQQVPANTYQAQCNWALYSSRCGVNRATHEASATITVVSGKTIQATAFGSQPDGYFNNGYVERTNGERRWIVTQVGAVVTLLSPFPDLAVSEVVKAYPGCDRTEAICLSKFNNVINYLGFTRVPTKNPFRTGVT